MEKIDLVYDHQLQGEIKDEFLPFMHANPILAIIYDRMLFSPNLPLQRRVKLAAGQECFVYVRKHKSFRNDEDRCYTYDLKQYKYSEDTWNEKLYHIIKMLQNRN